MSTRGFVTRWSVLRSHAVGAADLAPDGPIRDDVLAGWVAAACDAYLDRCTQLRRDGLEPRRAMAELPRPEALGRPATVVVTVSATEVRPASFTLAVRVRPFGGGGEERVFDTTCTVQLVDAASGAGREVGAELRAELIAIESSARHLN